MPSTGGAIVDLSTFAGGMPEHIDPALASDVTSSQVSRLLYDGLTTVDAFGTVHSAVAEEVSASDDATVWRFKLRADVTFDNGQPVLPSDFKFAWQRVLNRDLKSTLVERFSMIKGFDLVAKGAKAELEGVVADDVNRTLEVTLVAPYRDFPALVATTPFVPLPQSVFARDPTLVSSWQDVVMVGNGPFRMSMPWQRDRSLLLVRNERYYGGPAKHLAFIDSVEFRVPAQGADAPAAGELAISHVPVGRFDEARRTHGVEFAVSPVLGTSYWAFNFGDETIGGASGLLLRKAIASALDKKAITALQYGNVNVAATGFVPPGMPGYQVAAHSGDRNVEEAKDFLHEWGRPAPPLKLVFEAGAGLDAEAEIVRKNLNEIGIDAQLHPTDSTALNGVVSSGSFQMLRTVWQAKSIVYDDCVAPLFLSPPLGTQNVLRYSSQDVDQLVNAARRVPDVRERMLLYQRAERQVLGDQVVVPVSWTVRGMHVPARLKNVRTDLLGHIVYGDVWVAKS